MDLILLEDRIHLVIAQNLAFIRWILKVVRFDMCPDFLDDLGAGKLFAVSTIASSARIANG
jgi:hypothetical protein